ncbi:MAG: hypothetical protein R3346_03045 [Candidatus Spechtbacterales bacterium]|nr:hypothetical protein [Candidatus Spechtbacterales bacterium]
MQIEQTLPQFENKLTLVIVTGHQAAEFYVALNGKIEKESEIKVPNPEYSDREGYFKRSGHGLSFGSGSVVEPKNKKVEKKFLKDLEEEVLSIKKSNEQIKGVYLFGPDYMLKRIRKTLPKQIANNLIETFEGNYTQEHPFEFLKIIKSSLDKQSSQPKSSEAQKIYKKTE